MYTKNEKSRRPRSTYVDFSIACRFVNLESYVSQLAVVAEKFGNCKVSVRIEARSDNKTFFGIKRRYMYNLRHITKNTNEDKLA